MLKHVNISTGYGTLENTELNDKITRLSHKWELILDIMESYDDTQILSEMSEKTKLKKATNMYNQIQILTT